MTLAALLTHRLRLERHKPPKATIHVVVVAPDERLARKIRNQVAVYTPRSWDGEARLHLVIGNGTELSDQLRTDLADLQLIRHEDLDLVYPVDLQIGWENR